MVRFTHAFWVMALLAAVICSASSVGYLAMHSDGWFASRDKSGTSGGKKKNTARKRRSVRHLRAVFLWRRRARDPTRAIVQLVAVRLVAAERLGPESRIPRLQSPSVRNS
jgi:hypothetical protein